LENVLTQAVIRLRGNVIEIDNLNISNQSESTSANPVNEEPMSLASIEVEHIRKVLTYCMGHKGNSCKILGISRPALDRKILKYNLSSQRDTF
jgi:two-component system response regulator AtoC